MFENLFWSYLKKLFEIKKKLPETPINKDYDSEKNRLLKDIMHNHSELLEIQLSGTL